MFQLLLFIARFLFLSAMFLLLYIIVSESLDPIGTAICVNRAGFAGPTAILPYCAGSEIRQAMKTVYLPIEWSYPFSVDGSSAGK